MGWSPTRNKSYKNVKMKSIATIPVVLLSILFVVQPTWSQDESSPQDLRLTVKLKTLDDDFTFTPPQNLDDWKPRREELRRQILLANGLWPMPPKTDLKPIVHHKIERPEYDVYGVILEVVPDYYLTGNLYVPKNIDGKMPGILSPHGHWGGGRFYAQNDADFKRELEAGAEKYDPSGKYPLQARCATLARLGCVVFHYDMIGYADSVQIQEHRPGVRDYMNTKENWGLFSPQAELRLQNVMGLQTLASVRALDWLETLPQVDPKRLAITGASGGGTQSFVLSAIDDRLSVQFPAVMVSTAMQGGCTCENAPYLRVNTGNVEIAALFAPKPLGMTAADDWTKEMETKGLPALKKMYEFYDAADSVSLFPHLHFGHNYNFVSRNDMYGFMNQHLNLGHDFSTEPEKSIEQPFEPLSIEEMTVWTGDHPKPSGNLVGDEFERKLLREMNVRSNKQLNSLTPKPTDPKSLAEYKKIVGGAWATIIGRTLPDKSEVENDTWGGFLGTSGEGFVTRTEGFVTRIKNKNFGEVVPGMFLTNKQIDSPNGTTAILISPGGINDFLKGKIEPNDVLRQYMDKYQRVLILDLLGQGTFTKDGDTMVKAKLVDYGDGRDAWQQSLSYTYGYNFPVFSKRVHDILTATAVVQQKYGGKIVLAGLNGAGHYAAAARAIAPDAYDELIVETGGFRFANIESLDDIDMVPGAVKYGDLPGILALSAPNKTTIHGEKPENLKSVQAAYAAAGKNENLKIIP